MSKMWATLAAVTVFIAGCGGPDGRARHAGQAVGETLTDFARGVTSGVDEGLKVDVELSEGLTALGLSRTVAKAVSLEGGQNGLTVYIKSQQPVTVTLIAKAMDGDDEEIGRSTVDVELADDDAKYVTFPFQAEMDYQLVRRYIVDARPTSAAQTGSPKSASPEAEREE